MKAVEFLVTAPLSQDLRQRIVRMVDAGSSIRTAAKRFEVSPSAAIKLMQRLRATGSTAPARIGGYFVRVFDSTPDPRSDINHEHHCGRALLQTGRVRRRTPELVGEPVCPPNPYGVAIGRAAFDDNFADLVR